MVTGINRQILRLPYQIPNWIVSYKKQLFLLVRIHIFFLSQTVNYKEEAPQAPVSNDITNKYT